ncbi:hypothetical protein INR49_030338 [Caranx melampygus]|nr:hypothetical protein INR49_030338 [Caranx melampygus]
MTNRQLGWQKLFVVLTVLPCCRSIEVSIPEKEYEVARGGEINLICSFIPAQAEVSTVVITWEAFSDNENDPLNAIATSFSGKPVDIAPAYEGRAFMDVNLIKHESTLRLTKVTMQDNRRYQCSVLIPGDSEGTQAAITSLLVLGGANEASLAVVVGGAVAGVLVLGILIFCCCRRNGKNDKYVEGAAGDVQYYEKDGPEFGDQFVDEKSNSEMKQSKQYEDKNTDQMDTSLMMIKTVTTVVKKGMMAKAVILTLNVIVMTNTIVVVLMINAVAVVAVVIALKIKGIAMVEVGIALTIKGIVMEAVAIALTINGIVIVEVVIALTINGIVMVVAIALTINGIVTVAVAIALTINGIAMVEVAIALTINGIVIVEVVIALTINGIVMVVAIALTINGIVTVVAIALTINVIIIVELGIALTITTIAKAVITMIAEAVVITPFTVRINIEMCVCDGVNVIVREKQRFAMLFQSVVLPCQYQTASTQTPVVQWWYKSYCRDRSRESFNLPETLGIQTSELGATSHLECSDSSRTVRVVASAQGASMTLAEHYKGRDIAIINSNVIVLILHVGKIQLHEKADLRIGELQWGDSGVYFCKVVIADDLEGVNEGQLELLVLGRTGERDDILPEFDVEIMPVYEAGKMAKSGQPPQLPVYPYYIPGVPTVVPLAPSTIMDPKITSIPSVENNLAGASSLSELSSLHDGGNTDFRHTYQTVQMKALPPIADLDDQSVLRAAPPTQSRRPRRDRGHLSDDELDRRWNPRSEHLKRKTLGRRGRTGSLDELEEFARSYGSRGRRAEPPDRFYDRDYSPPRRFYRDEDDDWRRRSPSPLPQKRRDTWDSDRPCRPPQRGGYDDTFLNSVLESKARGQGGDRAAGRMDEDSDTPSKGSSRGKGSNSYYSRSPSNRPEEEDPLPPYSELEAERYRRADLATDRYRTAEPPRSERYRTTEPNTRPFCYTRPHQGMSHTLQGGREERDRNRNLVSYL